MFTFLNGKIEQFQCSLKYTSIQSLPSFDVDKICQYGICAAKQACLVTLYFGCGSVKKAYCPIHGLCFDSTSYQKE